MFLNRRTTIVLVAALPYLAIIISGASQTTAFAGTRAATTTSATANYVTTDTTTEGNWTGTYGADGQIIPNDITNAPAYATISFTGASTWSWAANTNDARALQSSRGSSTRIASTFFSVPPNSFAINLNLTDGNTHRLALYLCDWDGGNRNETVTILDAVSGSALSSRTFSNFTAGIWGVWHINGNVTIQITNNGASVNPIVNGAFLDSAVGATATYLTTDTTTQGTWTGTYGSDGEFIPDGITNAPAYAAITFSGQSTYQWPTSQTSMDHDPARQLQSSSGSSTGIVSVFLPATNTNNHRGSSFTINVNLTDGNIHRLALYLCDWDSGSRDETITISDAVSGSVLSTRTYSNFISGVWAVWNIEGSVTIQVVNNNALSNNPIVNGVFLDSNITSSVGSTATFLTTDTTTRGNWPGTYGADGQIIPNSIQNPPAYASVSLSGASNWTWSNNTTDVRALQSASGSSTLIASTFFAGPPSSSFTINLSLTDGYTHRLALYLCDWDGGNRNETITISDANSRAPLSTQTYSNFTAGIWAVWYIKGNLTIQITNNGTSVNPIVNGVFLDSGLEGGCKVLPANNVWNTSIAKLPVDANSDAYIATEGGSGLPLHPDFGTVYEGAPNGVPYAVVPASETPVTVLFTQYGNQSDPSPYPIPLTAPVQGGLTSMGDRHVIALEGGTCQLSELWSAYPQETLWEAGSGAVFDLTSNALRPDGWTSADAAGLPVFPGLVKYDEVQAALASDGVIHHALRFTSPYTAGHIWPARHDASTCNSGQTCPPMGQRFRLKASVDTSSTANYPTTTSPVSPINLVILRTLQEYGMFLADNGGGILGVSGVPDTRWNDSDLHDLVLYNAADFEAVDETSLYICQAPASVATAQVSGACPTAPSMVAKSPSSH